MDPKFWEEMKADLPEHDPPSNEPWIPEYFEKFNEPSEDKQRKRGMLENSLLLGNSF